MVWRILIGSLALVEALALGPGVAAGQMPPRPVAGGTAPSIADEWELRGVAIAPPGARAILANRQTGQQHVLRVGDLLVAGVAVAEIGEDRVVLRAQGSAVTLRLAHGGPARVAPPAVPVRSSRPPRNRAPFPWIQRPLR